MERNCPEVDSLTNLQTFAEEFLLHTGRRCFVVTVKGEPVGLVTLNDVTRVERPRRPYTLVGDVMRPLDNLHTVNNETPLTAALETMTREDVNQLPVVSAGHVDGIITRASILAFLQKLIDLNG